MIRVGFDVSPLVRATPRGVARVVDKLLTALESRRVIEVVRLAPPEGRRLSSWRQRELPRTVRRDELVGLHSFTSSFPLRGPGRRIQTIHELPWRHGVVENAGLRHRLWAALGPLRADRVICPTEHVARDLRARRLPGARRIHVVPWGVAPVFAPEPQAGEVDEVLLGRYRLGADPIVLCLGSVRPKKNLAAVLHGAAAWRDGGGARVQIVVTGGDTPTLRRDLGLAARLGLSGWMCTLDEVTAEDLPGLLRLASVVPVLSHSEGFGLPVLEALACGTPVLVPAGTAQGEVAGEAGIVVSPTEPASVAAGLGRAVAERERLRFVLPERARAFSWAESARAVEELWQELAS